MKNVPLEVKKADDRGGSDEEDNLVDKLYEAVQEVFVGQRT